MTRRTENEVRDLVEAALRGADVDAEAIEVDVDLAVERVTLRGTVASHSERLGAISAAIPAAGALGVRDHLTVAPFAVDYRMSDDEVAAGVARALLVAEVPLASVRFDVEHHVVTLSGVAADDEQRAHVRHVVQAAPGVHFVRNGMTVASAVLAGRSSGRRP
jgi:osmotically-inducible protein OsmY